MKNRLIYHVISLSIVFNPLSAALTFSVSGNPAPMTINSAVAGSPLTSVSDTSTSYTLATDNKGAKLSARLNTSLPSGVTLKLLAAAPTGATSTGTITLSTTNQDLVTGIPPLTPLQTRSLTYTLAAAVTASLVVSKTVTVTLTLR